MLRYDFSPGRFERPFSRWIIVGSNVIIFFIAVCVIDFRIGDVNRDENSPQISQSSIVPIDLVIKEAKTAPPILSVQSKKPSAPRDMIDSIRPWLPTIQKYSKQFGVDPDLVSAVLYIESKGDPYSVSPAGALGLMQITPSTAEHLGAGDMLDPEENIKTGVKYLSWLIERYDETSALEAYNAGLGMLEQNRIPPETREFVDKVLSLRNFLHENKKTNDLS